MGVVCFYVLQFKFLWTFKHIIWFSKFPSAECSFSGWGQFLQSFCRSTSEFVISPVLLQKLCKNCPHPEKPFSNSKTISQIKFPYRIEKLIKSQQECLGGKTLCRSLVTCKGFFCPVVLLLLLCENVICHTFPNNSIVFFSLLYDLHYQ